MNWERIKKASDVCLEGVTVELEKLDANVRAVTLRDAKGNAFRLVSDSTYSSLSAYVPAKPKTEKKFALVGEVRGLKVDELFATEWEAKQRRDDLDTVIEAAKLEIVPREVEVSE